LNKVEITDPNYSITNNDEEINEVIRDKISSKGQANVFWNRKYTLFDFATDEPILPEMVNGEPIYKPVG
jgi:hypothetical protein